MSMVSHNWPGILVGQGAEKVTHQLRGLLHPIVQADPKRSPSSEHVQARSTIRCRRGRAGGPDCRERFLQKVRHLVV